MYKKFLLYFTYALTSPREQICAKFGT